MAGTMIDWRKHPRQLHCRCDRCRAQLGPISRRIGKLWQAQYGESNKNFRKRYLEAHKGKVTNVQS